jgi:tetratricopeptide (TPR) repeat protein
MYPRLRASVRQVRYFSRIVFIRGLLILSPNSEWALFHLANAYAGHGAPERAVPLWQKVAASGEPRPAAFRNLAVALINLERPLEALAPLHRLAERDNDPADTYALIGLAYQRAQHYDSALISYERSLALHPRNDALRLTIGLLLERHKKPILALNHYRVISDPNFAMRAAQRIAAIESRGNKRQLAARVQPGRAISNDSSPGM